MDVTAADRFRIGELARRVGVSTSTLRSWERRYGLLKPERSDGNYRLYSAADEERIRHALHRVDLGMSMAEAARATLARRSAAPTASDIDPATFVSDVVKALTAFDSVNAVDTLDRAFTALGAEVGLRDIVLPAMREVGTRWQDGRIGVEEEHFASNLVLERLHAVASEWRPVDGPSAVLACAPGERHSIGLACLGVGLRARGWTVRDLGADTPLDAIRRAAATLGPGVVVLAATDPGLLTELPADLELPPEAELAVGGAGADSGAAERLGATLLDTDPLTAAAVLDARHGRRARGSDG